MNILVTGGAGYLGSVLVPKLLARGHRVRVLDVGYFGVGHLRALRPPVELVREDIRRVGADRAFREEVLRGCDCVIHLAAISNDPSAELDPELTEAVNFEATQALAEAVKAKGIRLLFSSSCSAYGVAAGEADEDAPLKPLTTYSVSKVKAERMLEDLAGPTWSPVILRNGTLFGYSARMRFDLVVNIFSLYSTLYNEIRVFGDGGQWRPFLHVRDCARAFVYFAEEADLRHRCYNIAHANWRINDVARVFQAINPRLTVRHVETDGDQRNYRASMRRMRDEGFETHIGVDAGAEEMTEAIVSGLIPDPGSVYYRNAKWLKELSQVGFKDHRDLVRLLETLAQVRRPSPE